MLVLKNIAINVMFIWLIMLIKLIMVTTQVFKPTRWKPTSTTEHDCRAAAEGHARTCRLSGDLDLDDDDDDDDADDDDDNNNDNDDDTEPAVANEQ